MNRLWGAVVAIVLVVLGTAWFVDRGGIFPTKRIYYRYEVTVDTPTGLITNNSIHRFVIQDTTMTPARNYQLDLDGEAVPFELPDGSILLATLSNQSDVGLVRVFGATVGLGNTGKWIDAPKEFNAEVHSKYFPRLAIVDDRNDPRTLMRLDVSNDFEVVRVRMVSTDEPMTEHLSELLPWLVESIRDLPTISTRITDHHILISSLRVGLRS